MTVVTEFRHKAIPAGEDAPGTTIGHRATVYALDPGTEKSALVVWDGSTVLDRMILTNDEVLAYLTLQPTDTALVIEEFESYGMAVGREVFQTVRWAGRFEQVWWPKRVVWMPRRIVKQHLCHTARATDGNIRQALIDRFGGTEAAIGKKKTPGPLFAVKSHCWAALAIAITWHDTNVSAV